VKKTIVFSFIGLALLVIMLPMSGINYYQVFSNLKNSKKEYSDFYKPKDYSHLFRNDQLNEGLLKMHVRLYDGYVKNTNFLLGNLKCLIEEKKAHSNEYNHIKMRYSKEYEGMKLHELYFDNLGGEVRLDEDGDLYKNIESQFGSYGNWVDDFCRISQIRGIGWVILYLDSENGRLTNLWIKENDDSFLVNGKPLLVMDVVEHAYIQQFGNDKEQYLKAFFANINWDEVVKRYQTPKN
jgi:superoxide dismutase, Fe-Mn family